MKRLTGKDKAILDLVISVGFYMWLLFLGINGLYKGKNPTLTIICIAIFSIILVFEIVVFVRKKF